MGVRQTQTTDNSSPYRRITATILTLLCLVLLSACDRTPEVRGGNLFEEADPGIRRSWKSHGTLSTENSGRLPDESSIKISTEEDNDILHVRRVTVNKGHYYRFSAWVKTEAVKGNIGANLSIAGTYNHSRLTLTGDTPWTLVEQVFRACEDDQINFALRLGSWDNTASGTAWFSEVQLTELAQWPGSYQPILKTSPKGPRSSMPLRYFIFFGFVPWLVGFLYILRNDQFRAGTLHQSAADCNRSSFWFWLLILSALAVRLMLAPHEGMTSELGWLKILALDLGQPQQFLQGYGERISGQHPFLLNLYFAAVGWLIRLGSWETSALFTLLLKLPALLLELVVAGLAFRWADRTSNKYAWLLLLLLLFNPAILFSSAFWGQTTTFSAGLLVCAVYLLQRGRIFSAGLLLGALCSYSLQWPFLVILFILSQLLQRNRSQVIHVSAGVLSTSTLFCLPALAQHDFAGIAGNFYPGLTDLSLITMNFWALIGLNIDPASGKLFGFSGLSWGLTLSLLVLAAAVVSLTKQRNTSGSFYGTPVNPDHIEANKLWATFTLLTFGLFLFLPDQQGQNLLPVLFLLSFLVLQNRYYAWALWALSTLCFLNQIFAYWSPAYRNSPPPSDSVLLPIGAGILLLMFLAQLRIELKSKPDFIDRILVRTTNRIPQSFRIGINTAAHHPLTADQDNAVCPPFKMLRWDWCALVLIWSLTTGLLLVNLGNLHFPTQGHLITDRPESFEIDLGRTVTLTEVGFYGGEIAPEVRFEAWSGDKWRTLWGRDDGFLIYPAATDYRKTFKNKQRRFKPVNTSRVRVIVREKGASLQELALFGTDQQLIIPQSITANSAGKKEPQPATDHAFFDEQDKVGPFARHLTNTYWDEVFYARSAFDLAIGQPPYEKTHPPFGKTIIGSGIQLFGMTPFGWRIMPALAISVLPLLLFYAGRWLSGRRMVAYLAATLCVFECLTFTIGRMANIDGFLVIFQTAMLIALLRWYLAGNGAVNRNNLPWLVGAGVFFGLAVSIKWSAIFCGFAVFLLIVGWHIKQLQKLYREQQQSPDRRLKNFVQQTLPKNLAAWCGCLIIVPLAIYYFSHYQFMQSLDAKPGLLSLQGIEAFWDQQKYILGFHGGKKAFDGHSLASPFYSWPLLAKPVQEIYINSRLPDDLRSTISMVGNPAIFWLGFMAMLGWAWQALKGQSRTAILLAGCYFAQFLPWIMVQRPSFFYAYFPFLPLLTLGLATATAQLKSRKFSAGLAFLSIALFILFYPAISGLPMPEEYFEWLHWFDSWSDF